MSVSADMRGNRRLLLLLVLLGVSLFTGSILFIISRAH